MRRLLLLTVPWLVGLALLTAVQPERDSVPGIQPFPARLGDEIHEIRDKMSAIRGLPVNRGIEEGSISETDLSSVFQQAVTDLGSEFEATLRSRTEAMRLMHLIGPNDDLELLISGPEGSSGVAGVYVPSNKSLLVVGDVASIGLMQEFVLAHEYIHSFQDQAFNLEDVFIPGRTPFTETSIIGQCLAEGDATVGAQEYMNEMHGTGWERKILEEAFRAQLSAASRTTTQLTTLGLVRYAVFVYSDCAEFITAIKDSEGWRGVDAIYAKRPESTEQILHPEKYKSRERPNDIARLDLVPVLGTGWQQESSERFGELDVLAYLFGLSLDDASARKGAEGWGGGQMTIYTNATDYLSETLVHVRLSWDSAAEMAEFRTEYHRALTRPGPLSLTNSSTRQIESSRPLWQWQVSSGDQGYARWNDVTTTTDIVLSTSEPAMSAAQKVFSALGDMPTRIGCSDISSPRDRVELVRTESDSLGLITPLTVVARYTLESHDSARLVLFHGQKVTGLATTPGVTVERGSGEVTITVLPESQTALGEYHLQLLPPIQPQGPTCSIPFPLSAARFNVLVLPQR